LEFIDAIILFSIYFATGLYALNLFRSGPRISTFVYVWLATGSFFISGLVYRMWSGHLPYYIDGLGATHYLTRGGYSAAILAAALGLSCVAAGHRWASLRRWSAAIPEFFDRRVADRGSLRRWAFIFLLAGFIPLVGLGIYNPVTLVDALLHGRAVTGAAGTLYSQGNYFSFFKVFASLVPFGVAAVAVLIWSGDRPISLVALAGLMIFITFLSGTRSATAFLLLPFIVLPRYMGQNLRFQKMVIVGGVALMILFEIMLVYRSSGFDAISVARTIERASPVAAVGGKELDLVGEAMALYGKRYPLLDGQSYEAVIVNPIPRVFWHSKPISYSNQNARNLGYAFGTTITSGWMGEAYANFGWIGIPLIGLIAGALMGWLDAMLANSGAFATAIFLPLQFQWAFWVRGDSANALDPWLFGLILASAALLLVHPARIVISDNAGDATATG
jgi:hypothetical protein